MLYRLMKKYSKHRILTNRYATAFFELAQDKNNLDSVLEDFEKFVDTSKMAPELLEVVKDEEIPLAKRHFVIREVAKKLSIKSFVLEAILLLVDKNRVNLLESILESFREKKESLERLMHVEVQIADESLTSSFKKQIEQVLTGILKKRVFCEVKINPVLIGGAVIRIGDVSLDASVLGRLKQMQKELS